MSLNSAVVFLKIQISRSSLCPLASSKVTPGLVLKRSHNILPLCLSFFCWKYCFRKYILVFFSDGFSDRISNGSNFVFLPLGIPTLHLHVSLKSMCKLGFFWVLLRKFDQKLYLMRNVCTLQRLPPERSSACVLFLFQDV